MYDEDCEEISQFYSVRCKYTIDYSDSTYLAENFRNINRLFKEKLIKNILILPRDEIAFVLNLEYNKLKPYPYFGFGRHQYLLSRGDFKIYNDPDYSYLQGSHWYGDWTYYVIWRRKG